MYEANVKDSPCVQCKSRFIGSPEQGYKDNCHNTCDGYKQYKSKVTQAYEKRKEFNAKLHEIDSYEHEKIKHLVKFKKNHKIKR